jgi:hypothetical protein
MGCGEEEGRLMRRAVPLLALSTNAPDRLLYQAKDRLAAFALVDGVGQYDDDRVGAMVRLGARWVRCDWCSRPVLVDENYRCQHIIDLDSGTTLADVIASDEASGRASKKLRHMDLLEAESKPPSQWSAFEIEVSAARYCSPECMTLDDGLKNPGRF